MMLGALLVAAGLAASPEQVTFQKAIERALQNNPVLKVAAADVDRAHGLTEQARAPSLPSLSANLTYIRLDADRVLNGNVIAGANQLTGNVQLQVPIVAPPRWAQWKRAEDSEDLSRLSLGEVRRQVALNAARTWLSVLAQHRVVQAQISGVETAQAHLNYSKNRKDSGLGNQLDVLRAEQEVSLAQSQQANAQGLLEKLQEQLGLSLGTDNAMDVEETEPELSTAAKSADAVTERTDVRVASRRVEAAVTSEKWNWAEYAPLLSAVVQPGYQNPPTLTVPLWAMQAQVVLTLPLYDGGFRYGQHKERAALEVQARAQLESLTLQARSEVRSAMSSVTRADEALKFTRSSSQQADAALKLSEAVFAAGGSTNLEVIDAQRRARDAAISVALSENASRQARLELLAATGELTSSQH